MPSLNAMAKFVVYSKWFWTDGVPEDAFVQDWLRGRKPNMIAEDTVLLKVDDNHHGSVTTYATEADFKKERVSVLEERKRNHEEGAQLIDENIGSVVDQMSGL